MAPAQPVNATAARMAMVVTRFARRVQDTRPQLASLLSSTVVPRFALQICAASSMRYYGTIRQGE
jgi:hypothetical protein